MKDKRSLMMEAQTSVLGSPSAWHGQDVQFVGQDGSDKMSSLSPLRARGLEA